MNIPQITGIDNALQIFYNYAEIGNKEMAELFGKHSPTTFSRLKKIAKSEMSKRDICSHGANKINTEVAFEVWGIDVKDLERRRKKISELNLA
jgi:hypothetical protein